MEPSSPSNKPEQSFWKSGVSLMTSGSVCGKKNRILIGSQKVATAPHPDQDSFLILA